jgi:hypothetical protein
MAAFPPLFVLRLHVSTTLHDTSSHIIYYLLYLLDISTSITCSIYSKQGAPRAFKMSFYFLFFARQTAPIPE